MIQPKISKLLKSGCARIASQRMQVQTWELGAKLRRDALAMLVAGHTEEQILELLAAPVVSRTPDRS